LEAFEVNFSNFFQSGKIHDHKELIRQVDSAMNTKGVLSLVVGGKNVGVIGKSLVVAHGRDFFNLQPLQIADQLATSVLIYIHLCRFSCGQLIRNL
jgi:hypothetical protein